MVQARQLHTLGPTVAGRVQTLRVDVGDSVQAGQVLGSMDPVDLDARIRALEAAQARAQASVQEAQTRQHFAAAQLQRYAQLAQAQATSAESLHLKRQGAMWPRPPGRRPPRTAAHPRGGAALRTQRQHLQLIAPQAAIVTARAVGRAAPWWPGKPCWSWWCPAACGFICAWTKAPPWGWPRARQPASACARAAMRRCQAAWCAEAEPHTNQRDRGCTGQSGLHRGAHPHLPPWANWPR